MVKYFCDMCGEEVEDKNMTFDVLIDFNKVAEGKMVCRKCKKQICEFLGIKHGDDDIAVTPREISIYMRFKDEKNGAQAIIELYKTRTYYAHKTSDGYAMRVNGQTVGFSDKAFEKLFERLN